MPTATLLPLPRLVVFNQLGDAAAGGFVHTYEVGTTTPRVTWQDAAETVPNSNPIVLDADGSAILYGAGSYTIVTTDSAGNLIPAYCGLSQDLSALLAAEVARATAAEAALASEDLTLQANINAEAATRAAADLALQAGIVAETAARIAADAVLQAEIDALIASADKTGDGTTDGTGLVTIVYGTPFPASTDNVQLQVVGGVTPGGSGAWLVAYQITRFGFKVQSSSPAFGGSWVGGPIGFHYTALGT